MSEEREGIDGVAGVGDSSWVGLEISGSEFADIRLTRRFQKLMEQLAKGIGKSISLACQDWASTKAAYLFLSNERVGLEQILAGHFQSTQERVAVDDGPILVVHDTTEFVYNRSDPVSIGLLGRASTRRDENGDPVFFTHCGISLHSSMAIIPTGLPLGLIAARFWSRNQFRGKEKRQRVYLAPIEEKESMRWLENLQQATSRLGQPQRCVHIADQEGDIYEMFCAAKEQKTNFLIRTRADRKTGSGQYTIAQQIRQTPCRGTHPIKLPRDKGEAAKVVLEVRYGPMQVLAPVNKRKRFSPMDLTIIHAKEQEPPQDREPIEWTLITNVEVVSLEQAVEKLNWYTQRWKIETFHKILKTGCKAEEAKFESAGPLNNFLAILCILSWRIFWLTMIQRSAPDTAPDVVFTPLEIRLLDELKKDKPGTSSKRPLSTYLIKVAKLGGYLARNSDPPPGNMVIWRGFSRLVDIQLGALLGAKLVGN